jgi:hypothetical protein
VAGFSAKGRWHDAFVDVLRRTQLAQPDELPEQVNAAVRRVGIDVTMYLVDQEQLRLHPLPERGKPTPPPLPVEASLPGRVFTTVQVARAGGVDGPHRLWIPLVDGAERLGVAEVLLHEAEPTPELTEHCKTLVGLVGHLVATKSPYGDLLHQVRRNRAMTVGGELLTSMLPPLTFSCHRLAISGIVEPCYDLGGDAFDYAVDGSLARLAVLDAMGRGLKAGLTCAVALAASRAARRDGHGLYDMARAVDGALQEQFDDLRFVTGVLAELDLETGHLRYVNAGHPPPLLLRRGRAVRALTGGRRLPMGIEDYVIEVGEEFLEPGDRLLLHTDGVTEARSPQGVPFGTDQLVDLAERSAAAGLPAPETLRRMAHQVLEYQHGRLTDDATLLLAEWSSAAAERTQP